MAGNKDVLSDIKLLEEELLGLKQDYIGSIIILLYPLQIFTLNMLDLVGGDSRDIPIYFGRSGNDSPQ